MYTYIYIYMTTHVWAGSRRLRQAVIATHRQGSRSTHGRTHTKTLSASAMQVIPTYIMIVANLYFLFIKTCLCVSLRHDHYKTTMINNFFFHCSWINRYFFARHCVTPWFQSRRAVNSEICNSSEVNLQTCFMTYRYRP